MANYTQDPNMGFLNPTPGVDGGIGVAPAGQDYATLTSQALTTIGGHGHTGAPNDGKMIVTGAININGDLAFNSFNVTNLRSARFQNQAATLTTPSDINQFYTVNGNAYFNNASGTPVQLTNGSSIATPPGSNTVWSFLQVTGPTHTILSTDNYTFYSLVTTSNTITITLPAAAAVAPGTYYVFKDSAGNAQTNNITYTPAGADTIDGAASRGLKVNYGSTTLVSDGVNNWSIERPGAISLFNNPINGTAATAGQFLIETATVANGSAWVSITGDISSSTTAPVGQLTVNKLSGDGYSVRAQPGVNLVINSNGNTTSGLQGGIAFSRATSNPSSPATNYSALFADMTSGALSIYPVNSSIVTASFTNHVFNQFVSMTCPTTTVTTGYTVDSGQPDFTVFCNFSSNHNITLPTPTAGRILFIKDISGTAATNRITIVRHGSEMIEGVASSYALAATNYIGVKLQSDGTNWWITSQTVV